MEQPAIDWKSLAHLSMRPKLYGMFPSAKHLFNSCYQIGRFEYVVAVKQWNKEFTENSFFINSFYWAPSLAAFRRIISRDVNVVKADDGAQLPLPVGLRLEPQCVDFGSLSEYLASHGDVCSRLIDLYASIGWEKIGCCMHVERIAYYFRSSPPVPLLEGPYGVSFAPRADLLKVKPNQATE